MYIIYSIGLEVFFPAASGPAKRGSALGLPGPLRAGLLCRRECEPTSSPIMSRSVVQVPASVVTGGFRLGSGSLRQPGTEGTTIAEKTPDGGRLAKALLLDQNDERAAIFMASYTAPGGTIWSCSSDRVTMVRAALAWDTPPYGIILRGPGKPWRSSGTRR